MLKLSDIRLTEQCGDSGLRRIAAATLGVAESAVRESHIHKLSIDARRKPDVRFVYTLLVSVDDERGVLANLSLMGGDKNGSGKNHPLPNMSPGTSPGVSPNMSPGTSPNILPGMSPNVSPYDPPERYEFPPRNGPRPEKPPIVVGAGPAGLFASLCLAEAGVKCVILERGQPIEQRIRDVELFRRGAGLDPSSNIQFGEGGAGTFSDGKLTTGINDRRVRYVLERLVQFGAPEEILYHSKPHIGTDKLRVVVKAIRERLIELGCDIRFGHTLADIAISDGAIQSVTVLTGGNSANAYNSNSGGANAGGARTGSASISSAPGGSAFAYSAPGGSAYTMAAGALILAPGNSAHDTFEMLSRRGVRLSPKGFSVGVRIEHLQRDIDIAQYGIAAVPRGAPLPAADYKMAAHLRSGRSVYTFCVCPGGQVVSSSSEPGGVVTNGMSHYARDDENCNGALLVPVTPDDYGNGQLDGVAFQRRLERTAFEAGGGNYCAPAQLVGDFLKKRASTGRGGVSPTYLPGVRYCNLWDVLPDFVCDALCGALPEFSGRIAGFADPGALLTAVETRSSSPVRIERLNGETVGVRGIFPCGEGSGYAGGIMSSAVDGIKCVEQIAKATGG